MDSHAGKQGRRLLGSEHHPTDTRGLEYPVVGPALVDPEHTALFGRVGHEHVHLLTRCGPVWGLHALGHSMVEQLPAIGVLQHYAVVHEVDTDGVRRDL